MKFYEDKVYIKMCKTAKEIQFGYSLKVGDVYYDTLPRWSYHNEFFLGNKIYLPRQDQLQEIVTNEGSSVYGTLNEFYEFVMGRATGEFGNDIGLAESPPDEIYNKFNSLEQLWLAFVMKEKFNKTWNGEDWV